MITLNDLFSAIMAEDEALTVNVIRQNPSLLLQHDNKGKTAIHVAIETQSTEILKLVFAHLKSIFPEQWSIPLFKATDKGYTPLTLAALTENEAVLSTLIDQARPFAPELARQSIICKNFNEENVEVQDDFLPLDLLRAEKPDYNPAIGNRLFALMEEMQYRPFKDPLDFREVLAKLNPAYLTPELLINLNYACLAINHVRRVVDICLTHPSTNSMSQEDRIVNLYLLKRQDEVLSHAAGNIETEEDFYKFIQFAAETIKQKIHGRVIANCQEICYLVIAALFALGVKKSIAMIEIQNDDHVLISFGVGTEKVVICAYLGEALPVIDQHLVCRTLKTCVTIDNDESIPKRCSFLLNFAPGFHRFVLSKGSFVLSDAFVQERAGKADITKLDPLVQVEALRNNEIIASYLDDMKKTLAQSRNHFLMTRTTSGNSASRSSASRTPPSSPGKSRYLTPPSSPSRTR